MKCQCGAETTVVDTRDAPERTVRRIRRCTVCRLRFRTVESVGDIAIKQLEQRRAKQRIRNKRAYDARTPEERKARWKRDRLRAAAREEARATGVSVGEVYKNWGVS